MYTKKELALHLGRLVKITCQDGSEYTGMLKEVYSCSISIYANGMLYTMSLPSVATIFDDVDE